MFSTETPLYPYQEHASRGLAEKNMLLAYDLGTGKTAIALHALESIRSDPDVPILRTLVLVPNSVKWQWFHEIQKFTSSSAQVVEGSPKQRKDAYLSENPDYWIMSYGTFMRDHLVLPKINSMVLDEATAIKSYRSQRSRRIKNYSRRIPIRFALTGTPIENGRLEELFSILEFVDRGVLRNWWDFEAMYVVRNNNGWISGYKNVDQFHQRVTPIILRKTHDDPEVSRYLPKVVRPDPINIPLKRHSRILYERIRSDVITNLGLLIDAIEHAYDNRQVDRRRGELMSSITAMRMLCDHPELLEHSSGHYVDRLRSEGLLRKPLSEGSAKMDAVVEYIDDFLDSSPGNKSVVFSSYVGVLPLLEERIRENCVIFHGGLSDRARDQVKKQFQTDPNTRVFLSSDAGGYGVDLPQSNLLINYDQPWQAGMAKQRNARIRRASSKWKHVVVQDFLSADSIEQRVWDMLRHKEAISEAALDGVGLSMEGNVLSNLESLTSFLKKGLDIA